MAQTVRKTRVVGNPGRRAFGRPRARPRKRKKSNPGQIVGWTLGNPGRKVNMAKANKKRNAGSHRQRTYKRRANPAGKTHHKRRIHHRRRSNPGRRHYRRNPSNGMGGVGHLITNAVFVVVGAIGSKLGAQVVLGTNNTGPVGYAGNAAAGAILWFLAEKVLKNRTAAEGIVAGTAVGIILRVINDYTPLGSYVNNLGMGDYQMQSFVTPQVLVAPMNNADIRIPNGWGGQSAIPPASTMRAAVGVPAAAPAASGMGQFNMWGGRGMY
jgi:hypothetical protein